MAVLVCTWDLYKSIPSLENDGKTVFDETVEFDEKYKANSMARLCGQPSREGASDINGFSRQDRIELLKLSNADEDASGASCITDWLSPGFFETEFWYVWVTTFAFQPWHSAIEFKRYLHRFILEFSRIEGAQAAIEGIGFILAFFACVVAHEFGHALAARRFGIRTPDIALLPIGGLARLERMPEKPGQEIVVALAGPAVNMVIAAALFLLMNTHFDFEALQRLDNPALGFMVRLASVNIFLVLFNLIPGFPTDGGRDLRAVLALWYPRTQRRTSPRGSARRWHSCSAS